MVVLMVVLIVAVALGGDVVFEYDGLVRKRDRTKQAWLQIDLELRRRHELIPDLVHVVAGHTKHESSTFHAVSVSRADAIAAGAKADPAMVGPARQLSTRR